MTEPDAPRPRIVIFNRYCLADQYDLATEFQAMITRLAKEAEVLHLSFRGTGPAATPPNGVHVDDLPLRFNRKASRDILFKTALSYLLLPWAAWKVRRWKADLVFLCECFPLWVTLFKLFSGTRVAYAYGDWHFHNILGAKPLVKPLLRLLEALDRFEVRLGAGFFCRARTAADRLKALGVDEDRIRVVRDAPDLSAFFPQDQAQLRSRCGFAPDDIVLLYHGVMHQGKGLDLLLRWTAELCRENPKVGLLMVGDGPEREPLQRLATELGVAARVHFTGWLPGLKEVGEYCNAADICVAMRTADKANEHIVPGALLHSMACRKVVIGPRLAGIGEIIEEGRNGYMFTPDDGEDFKRLIRELAARREAWPRVAGAAYQDILTHYTIEASARNYAGALAHFATVSSAARVK